jgi:hypothetical protein
LAICLDVADWFNEEYAAFLIVKGSAQRIEDDKRVIEKLGALLADRGYVFCVLGEFGDYWTFRDGVVDVGPGDSLLLVGTVLGIQRGRAVLDGLSPAVSIVESRVRPLGSALNVRVCPLTLPAKLEGVVNVRSGRLLREDPTAAVTTNYEWLGGICLDERLRKYLRQSLPYGVRFGKQEFRIDQLNRVNQLVMSLEAFERAVQRLNADATFEVRFPNGCLARLSVGVEPRAAPESLGFLVDQKGYLSPTLEPIGESDSSVIGFSGPRSGIRRSVSTRALANLIRDLANRQGRRVTDTENQAVWGQVYGSSAPEAVKRLVKVLLGREATVSEATLIDLRISS